jgi:hypothetical protein
LLPRNLFAASENSQGFVPMIDKGFPCGIVSLRFTGVLPPLRLGTTAAKQPPDREKISLGNFGTTKKT